MMNENIASGKWTEIKGRIRSAWGNLTDDELETTKGNMGTIAGLVQQKYGTAQEEVRKTLNDWVSGSSNDEARPSERRPA